MMDSNEFKELSFQQVGTKDMEKAYLYGDRIKEAWQDLLETPAEVREMLK